MPGEYTIAGGRADAGRLSRQAHVMQEGTAAFLSRLGVARGWRCLDVGCGHGEVAIALARTVGREGRVVGIDTDAGALELAREEAERADVRVEFVHADAGEPIEPAAFDLAYARLLLSHLVEPLRVLRAMRDAARPGGAVAVEDLFLGTLRSEPPAAVLDELQRIYGATVRFRGGDPTIGPRLPALLAAAGLEEVQEETVTNRIESVADKLFLALLVRNLRASILEAGAATPAQADALESGVESAARNPGAVFFQARIHQASGRRPG